MSAQAADMEPTPTPSAEARSVPLAAIVIGDRQRPVEPEAVATLADSLARFGMLQPVGLAPIEGGRFRLLWGAHRVAAADRLGWSEVPAIITADALGDDDAQAREIVENLHRLDLTAAQRDAQRLLLAGLLKQRGVVATADEARGEAQRPRTGGREGRGAPHVPESLTAAEAIAKAEGVTPAAVRRSARRAAARAGDPGLTIEADPTGERLIAAGKAALAKAKAKATKPKPKPEAKTPAAAAGLGGKYARPTRASARLQAGRDYRALAQWCSWLADVPPASLDAAAEYGAQHLANDLPDAKRARRIVALWIAAIERRLAQDGTPAAHDADAEGGA